MTQPSPSTQPTQPGRSAAFLVYVLYLLSIPSANVLALVGVIVALAARGDASPFARTHLDDQVRVWFIAFWWTIGLAVAALLGWLTLFLGVGFIILWIVACLAFLVMAWFTVKALLGLLALLDNRPR